uniref:ATP synthase F0 subunit 8 n=1 Tax=Achilidae gen. 1 sp. n. 1 SX-2018 TaxID=2232070 RepID=A0A3S5XHP4_9HEMI|nr:ATP synthase F0 subunit 8 [Achilidae gen. 1 sp. n. 1 SX-2018]
MPQMSPIMWTPILVTMTLMTVTISSNNFFKTSLKKNSSTPMKMKNKMNEWKW